MVVVVVEVDVVDVVEVVGSVVVDAAALTVVVVSEEEHPASPNSVTATSSRRVRVGTRRQCNHSERIGSQSHFAWSSL